jgi:NAD-dependent deacetylase sirtuin 7
MPANGNHSKDACTQRTSRQAKLKSDAMTKRREMRERMAQVRRCMDKPAEELNHQDKLLLAECDHIVKHFEKARAKRALTRSHNNDLVVDAEHEMNDKCQQLARMILNARGKCVVYTGAGVSTAASIPDYRGPQGLWTSLAKGIRVHAPDFALCKPTYAHMALQALHHNNLVTHVVSQNCDGLHLRSGLPRLSLSELHGNCFIELCLAPDCPQQEFARLFDTTERSSFRKHVTGRFCPHHHNTSTSKNNDQRNSKEEQVEYPLIDSIIHFGERLREGEPYNWQEATEALKSECRLIVCIGSSLKVLKHYSCLWPGKSAMKNNKIDLCIVNLQWTPKDSQATLKINGYCDQVMRRVVHYLNEELTAEHNKPCIHVEEYKLQNDPLLAMAIPLRENELHSTSKKLITCGSNNSSEPVNDEKTGIKKEENNQEMTDSTNNTSQISTNTTSNSWYNKSFSSKVKLKSTSSTAQGTPSSTTTTTSTI